MLTGVPKEGSWTMAGEGVPQIRALSIRMAGIRFALLRAWTTALDILQLGIAYIGTLFIGKDPFPIDHDVLHAAHKGRRLVGEVAQIGLQIGNGASQIRSRERGLTVIGRLIRAHRKDGLFIVGRKH